MKKGKKKVVLTPVQKLNRKVRELQNTLRHINKRREWDTAQGNLRVERFTKELAGRDQVIVDKNKALAARDEIIAQREAVIRLRDERIVELTNERNRIVRIVDQFTSVQITSHGTQLSAAINPSAPDKLRLSVPQAVAAQVQGNSAGGAKLEEAGADVPAWARASKYRSI